MRRSRPRADWVYRPDLYDDLGNVVDGAGTYTVNVKSMTPGVETARALILYDSENRLAMLARYTTQATVEYPRAARAEGRGPLILGVEGHIEFFPTTWALGVEHHFGWRIAIVEQDPNAPTVYFPPGYNMLLASTIAGDQAAIYRNSGNILWERHTFHRFGAGNDVTSWHLVVKLRCRRRLLPYQCLALYMEGRAGTVTGGMRPWLRTLVSDEGKG